MEGERLNKYLSRMGVCSRREADRLAGEGRITVDGRPAAVGEKVLAGQQVEVDGRPVGVAEGEPRPILLAVNKPRGIVCTTSDKDRAKNIVELAGCRERVYPVGRLDKDSEGLILLTNRGDLVNRIMRAANAHEKEYEVEVDRPLDGRFFEKMAAGVWLEELKVRTRPCRVWARGERAFSIILTQGLNRQIRRMCAAFGYQVKSLKRVRIMNIRLGGLALGASRPVKGQELSRLEELLANSGSEAGGKNHQARGNDGDRD